MPEIVSRSSGVGERERAGCGKMPVGSARGHGDAVTDGNGSATGRVAGLDDEARLITALERLGSAFPDPAQLPDLLVELAAFVARADGASLEQVDGPELVCTHGCGLLEDSIGTRVMRAASMSGLVTTLGEAQVSVDTSADERVDVETCRRLGIGSMVVLPLRGSQDIVAVLKVAAQAPHALTEGHLELLRPLAALGAARFGHASQNDAHRAAASLVSSVGDASRAILVSPEPARELCRWACRLVDAPHALVLEPDAAGALVTAAQSGFELPDLRLSPDEPSIAMNAFKSARLQLVSDYRSNPDVAQHVVELLNTADAPRTSSVAYVPLTTGGRAVGVLAVLLRDKISAANVEVLGLVTMLADEAGLAIERNRLQQQLERQARLDDLTGLPNRRVWRERLRLEMARAARSLAPLCMVLLDVDHFKAFNDTHGHQGGDAALKAVSVTWEGRVRESDLLARLGGEEFAVVLPDTQLIEAEVTTGRLLGDLPMELTASAGLAQWTGEDADAFYRRADEALYGAKAAGRNRFHVAAV
jgi:diguanylate cyclase (GGDEF)-like protein